MPLNLPDGHQCDGGHLYQPAGGDPDGHQHDDVETPPIRKIYRIDDGQQQPMVDVTRHRLVDGHTGQQDDGEQATRF